jgi:hypothetical protein
MTKRQFDLCASNSSWGSSRSRAGRLTGAEERAVDPRRPQQWCGADVIARDQYVAGVLRAACSGTSSSGAGSRRGCFARGGNSGAVTSVTPSSVPRNRGVGMAPRHERGAPEPVESPAHVARSAARRARDRLDDRSGRLRPLGAAGAVGGAAVSISWLTAGAVAGVRGHRCDRRAVHRARRRIVPEPACSDRGSGAGDSDARTTSGRMAEHFKPDVPSDPAVEFLLTFARVGHSAGYPTADLEGRVSSLADAVGLEAAQVSATPTTVEISLGSPTRQRSYAIRARPRPAPSRPVTGSL